LPRPQPQAVDAAQDLGNRARGTATSANWNTTYRPWRTIRAPILTGFSRNVVSYGYDHSGQRVFKATGTATTSYPNRDYNVASSSLTATTTNHIFSPDGTLLATVMGIGVGSASTGEQVRRCPRVRRSL
jgi:hypothetical protein